MAVTAPDLAGQFERNSPGMVQSISQWDQSGGGYSVVSPGQTVSAGSVLWVEAVGNAIVGISGAYSDPSGPQAQAGGGYLAGTGLEAWTPLFSTNCSQWSYDSQSTQWNARLSGNLAFLSGPPWTIAPGQALYVGASAPAGLEIPDPTLRVRYYHQDHLGSSSVITDSSGQIVEESAFYPFGLARVQSEARNIHDPYQFTQKERDLESGLHYFEARYLVSWLGRFASVDRKFANPEAMTTGDLTTFLANPQGMNLYGYGLNNPLKYQDPSGLDNHPESESEGDSPGDEMREGASNLFMFGAERDAAEWTGSFVKHAYQGAGTGRVFFNTLTAPVWLPVVVFGSAGVSIVKDTGHIVKGAVREGISVWGGLPTSSNPCPKAFPT